MTTLTDSDQRHEQMLGGLCLACVSVFTLIVVADEDVPLSSYVMLLSKYLSISLSIVVAAATFFAGLTFLRIGFRTKRLAAFAQALGLAFKQRWATDRFLSLLWPLATFLLLMPSFNAFKQRVLPRAGFSYDKQLAELDRAIFGTDPGKWLHETFGSPGATIFLDGVYHSWFLPTTLGVCVVALYGSVKARAQYMLAYIGTWILMGAAAAYLFPAAGPAFYQSLVDPTAATSFAAVHESLARTGGNAFLTSLFNQQYLLENMNNPELVVGAGISAIPSIHNAMAVLFAAAAFQVGRGCGLAASLFAILTWVASVYLNWHYAVDGLIGAAGALLLWILAGSLVNRMTNSRLEIGGRTPEFAIIFSPLTRHWAEPAPQP